MKAIKNVVFLAIGCSAIIMSCKDNDKLSYAGRLAKDIAAIDNYLAANNLTAIKDPSGLRLVVEEMGTGLPPHPDSEVRIYYTGKFFSDGSTFNQDLYTGKFIGFIQGWQTAMELMPNGTRATVYIPSGLAYGESGYGKIPGNSILIFELELLNVYSTSTETTKLQSDVQIIDKYANDNGIVTQNDASGLRYVITTTGTGATPSWYNKVKVKYSGKMLATNPATFVSTLQSSFEDGFSEPNSSFDSRVINFIDGWKIGLQKMQVGGKATFYVPSGLAYGAQGTDKVPANSNLVFDVELVEIVE